MYDDARESVEAYQAAVADKGQEVYENVRKGGEQAGEQVRKAVHGDEL
jgi:hypothetical protein